MTKDSSHPSVVTYPLLGVVADRPECPAIPLHARRTRSGDPTRRRGRRGHRAHPRASPGGVSLRRGRGVPGDLQSVLAQWPTVITFSTGRPAIPEEKKPAAITALRPAIGALHEGSMNGT